MRWSLILTLFIVIGCTGSLTEEQRKAVKEDMESHAIKKVSDAEITEAAYAKGRELFALLEKNKEDSTFIDSVVRANNGKIRWTVPGAANALAVEQQLIEAYISSSSGEMQDNIQKIRASDGTQSDSILYSMPVVLKQTDGTEVLSGVWNIWLSRKELIRAMK
jgi:hypothetical protein